MRFIIELYGAIFDIQDTHYAAYQKAVADVGWSCLDQVTFWRLWRKHGLEAALLTGARPMKIKQFWTTFQAHITSPESFSSLVLREDASRSISSLQRFGLCVSVTTGNHGSLDKQKRCIAASDLVNGFVSCHCLPGEPQQRSSMLAEIAAGDARSIVIASSDMVVRAGSHTQLFVIGLPIGCCHASRLHRSGADIVYQSFDEIITSLEKGAADMIKAGIKPASLG